MAVRFDRMGEPAPQTLGFVVVVPVTVVPVTVVMKLVRGLVDVMVVPLRGLARAPGDGLVGHDESVPGRLERHSVWCASHGCSKRIHPEHLRSGRRDAGLRTAT